jgi:hypothetical protein
MKRILTAVLLLVLVGSLYAQKPASFKGCAPEGSGKPTKANPAGSLSKSKQELNLLKNRDAGPTSIDSSVTLAAIMTRANDSKFKNDEGASIIGYVAHVKAGEPQETCNCARTDIADIHIDVVLNKKDAATSSKYMIVEITPRYQDKLGALDRVKAAIEGHWVKFTGWMMNDIVHRMNAKNTNPKGKAIWRATSWEIHPVTAFEVVAAP